ncbi:hypothetical protein Tco_1142462 [Tanacetum coccineum]
MDKSKNTESDLQEKTPEKEKEGSIEDVISNDSTETPPATIQETANETIQQSPPDIQLVKEKRRRDSKKKDEPAKKRKTKETESPGHKTRGSAKKQELEKKDKDAVKKRKRDEKTEFEKQFKSLRAKTTVKPLYDATKSLLPEIKRKIREMGFGCMLDFPFQKIPGKKKLESDSSREYDDKFLKKFKEQFEFKKFITTTDLSKLIQKTTNTDFMFQMNYLMLFANCMINYDNSSRLKYFVNWDDSTSENWYYGPNTVLMLIYLHYTKFDGEFGKVEVIEEDDEGNANETEIEKQKLREFQTVLKEKKELEDLLKENMELDELFNGDEKLALFVERFKEEFNKGMDKDENQAGTSGAVHWDVADTNMTTFELTETEKKAAEEKAANKAREMRMKVAENEAAEKEATIKEKEEAEKLAEAKKKEQAKKLAVAKKKKQAEKLAATKKKEEAEKLAATKKEQTEKLAATKKKEEAEKKAAAEKKKAAKKEKAEKKAAAKKKE